jgi:hypothetical protein
MNKTWLKIMSAQHGHVYRGGQLQLDVFHEDGS